MKLKNMMFVMICSLCLPFMVNAKEYCRVVSGNGKDIGSEIACGTEHFYIVDSNKDEVKMLAKYNLDVGTTVHKEKIEREVGDNRSDEDFCTDLANSKNGTPGASIEEGYCYYLTSADYQKVIQKEDAKSSHVDKDGNYLYPQIGDVYPTLVVATYSGGTGNIPADFIPDMSNPIYPKVSNGDEYNNYFYDLDVMKTNLYQEQIPNVPSLFVNELGGSLYLYEQELNSQNVTFKDLSLLTLSDLNKIANKRGMQIPYDLWYSNAGSITPDSYGQKIKFGHLKDFLSTEDSWLFDRSYWLRTGYRMGSTPFGLLFVDNLGDICGAGGVGSTTPGCQMLLRVIIGSGIRPTLTIPANELQYLIKTEVSDGGSISVVDNSLGGETITFDVSTNKGFRLKGLILRTDSGEEVEFSEEDLTYNDDGTVTISKNKFIMPFENVTIEAKWELESLLVNPKTGRRIFIFLGLLLGVVFVVKNVILVKKENV